MLQKQDGYNCTKEADDMNNNPTLTEITRLAVLASGSGTNLASLINAVDTGIIKGAEISLVISNKKDAYALIRAQEAGIPAFYAQRSLFASDEDYDLFIVSRLREYNIDIILLAGYLRIITKPLLQAFANRILNIHPSLLPEFGGKNMYGIKVHQAVIDSKVKNSGCSVHLVTEEIDGGPVLSQATIGILPDDTPESLAARILTEEHKLYPKTVNEFIKDKFNCKNLQKNILMNS